MINELKCIKENFILNPIFFRYYYGENIYENILLNSEGSINFIEIRRKLIILRNLCRYGILHAKKFHSNLKKRSIRI